jgi:hypothetical protein
MKLTDEVTKSLAAIIEGTASLRESLNNVSSIEEASTILAKAAASAGLGFSKAELEAFLQTHSREPETLVDEQLGMAGGVFCHPPCQEDPRAHLPRR